MTDKNPSVAADTQTKSLHPVYSVTNIQNKVRMLDGEKVTYSDWVKLFRLHHVAYEVLTHMDGSEPLAKTDPTCESWSKIDAIVLQWIYGTLSDYYLKRVIDNVGTAQQAWDRLHTVFLNNKNACAATLEHAFTTTTMASCPSLNEYFQRMKDLADQLNDVVHPVSESRLVLQMVTGLPQEYDTVASFITQADKSWDDARDMIEHEQRCQAARQSIQAALTVTNGAPNPTLLLTRTHLLLNPIIRPKHTTTAHKTKTWEGAVAVTPIGDADVVATPITQTISPLTRPLQPKLHLLTITKPILPILGGPPHPPAHTRPNPLGPPTGTDRPKPHLHSSPIPNPNPLLATA
ncbi:hypothetical protein HanHA300_Chr16g0591671 [Helianthus annuus]|nr:hypothetical protein HanHA300_Chr16g0591671 [Helianthus annuus]KAJ0440696.1 hypothetical protein HanIR_Chr16g0789611 [Helianthus annuus]KAJ0458793.1 hypothetical protein HanHA89_Chr16g0641841 [Helianthus annuus]KAJ0819426.1 hypothetical protein HanPSC8_Chr16g0695961 [Helianthus annuus]